jgi:L-asparagine oxygenase
VHTTLPPISPQGPPAGPDPAGPAAADDEGSRPFPAGPGPLLAPGPAGSPHDGTDGAATALAGVRVVRLTRPERLLLARTMDEWLDRVVGRGGAEPGTAEFFDAAEIAEGALPERAREALALLRRGAVGAVLLRGLPDDASPGPTPRRAGEVPAAPRVGHAWLAMAVRRLGHELGYALEKSGSLVHHVYPVHEQAAAQSNASSLVELGLHTENAFHPIRPDFITLYGVRVRSPAPATRLALIDDVLAHLSDDELDVLRQTRFTVRVVDSHRVEGERDLEVPLAVLGGSWRRPVVRWHGSVRGTDDVAARVARSFREAAGRVVREVRLQAGDLLAFSNERCLHGRDRFEARLDGQDRWLLRAYAVRDVNRAAGVVSPARPAVLRLDLAGDHEPPNEGAQDGS